MRLDLYQAECDRIAIQQTALLDMVKTRLNSGPPLNLLEQSGVLHALQILVENAIGKAKHWLKFVNLPVPVSAYDTFASLHLAGIISQSALDQWNAAIGLRNRIVHDYMNVDMHLVYDVILQGRHHFVADFLHQPITDAPTPRRPSSA